MFLILPFPSTIGSQNLEKLSAALSGKKKNKVVSQQQSYEEGKNIQSKSDQVAQLSEVPTDGVKNPQQDVDVG